MKPRAATATTTPATASTNSLTLPRGLRLHRRKRPPLWLGVAGVLAAGVGLGAALFGAPATLVLGTLAALLAIGAAIYSPALGLAVLAFSYPFDLTTYAGPLKLTTSEALLLILAAVLVGRHFLRHPPPIYRTPLDVPVVLFGIATILSLLGLAGFLSDQLVALVKAAGGFLLFFIVTQSLRDRRELWLVIGGVLGAGVILAAMTILPIVEGLSAVSDQNRAVGNLIDPNLFAGYLVLVIPLAVVAGLANRWRWAPIMAGLSLLLFGAALVATLSRGGWLGFAAGIAVLVVALPGRRRVILAVAGAAVLILLIGGLAGPIADRLGSTAGDGPLATFQSRLPIWSAAITIWQQHPVFGIGVDNFGNYVGNVNPDLDVNQAHDLFLNILVERGILGLIAFAFFLFVLFRTLVGTLNAPSLTLPRKRGREPSRLTTSGGGDPMRLLVAGILASFVAFLADSIFDVAYYDYKILLLFWLLVGIAASFHRLLTHQPAPP